MTSDLKSDLQKHETDVEQAIYRFAGNEELYEQCLVKFLQDPSMVELEEAIRSKCWDEAFTAAHALKGVAGNMGFIPLFHVTAEMVIRIRQGRLGELDDVFYKMKQYYEDISLVVESHCKMEGENR